MTETLRSMFGQELAGQPFKPPWLLRNGHLQTVLGSRLGHRLSERVAQEFCWPLADDSRIRVIWVPAGRKDIPTVILVHGMSGSSDSAYMQRLSAKFLALGWNSLLLNLYNLNPAIPKIFHAGCSRELGEVVNRVANTLAAGPLFLVGISMGGNILLKLLGEWGSATSKRLAGAAALSPLVDLMGSWKILERPSNFLYERYFLKRLKELVRLHIPESSLNGGYERVDSARTIREFDELVTAPLSGFRSAFDYYYRESASRVLSEIRVPTLILHAKDDPLLPWAPFRRPAALDNPHLLVHLTERGGHLAFLASGTGKDPDRYWAENRIVHFLSRVAAHLPSDLAT